MVCRTKEKKQRMLVEEIRERRMQYFLLWMLRGLIPMRLRVFVVCCIVGVQQPSFFQNEPHTHTHMHKQLTTWFHCSSYINTFIAYQTSTQPDYQPDCGESRSIGIKLSMERKFVIKRRLSEHINGMSWSERELEQAG